MISIKNLTFSHPNSQTPLFNDLSFDIDSGVTGIIGRNGSGKSTLLELIHDHHLINKGTNNNSQKILFDSGDKLLINHQNSEYNLLPWYSPLENLKIKSKFFDHKYDETKFKKDLYQFSINPDQKVSTLSGGQKQIVNFVVSLHLNPDILLLDEPTSALDYKNTDILHKMLKEWHSDTNKIVMIVSHSIEEIKALSDRILNLGENMIKIYDKNELYQY
jgi:ABC-2 type transport system ATP-binding protein